MELDSRCYFPSQRAAWASLMIWVMIVGSLYLGGVVLSSPDEDLGAKLVVVLVVLVSAGGMGWILYGTGYELSGRDLILRCGPMRVRIPLQAIQAVEPCGYFSLAGLAWGLGTDTLRVDYQGRWRCARITPADKRGFLLCLDRRCEHLELRDDRLVPPGRPAEEGR
jgi:hypothetical protein